jgi:hypothetical protein
MTDRFQSGPALFEEEQRFRQPWLWAVVISVAVLPALVLLPPLRKLPTHGSPEVAIAVAIGTLALVLGTLLVMRLTVRVTPEEIEIRYVPFVDRHISIADIAGFEPRTYNPILAGYGIHITPYGWVYNVSGREGVALTLTNGKRLLIGTQRQQELVSALAQAGARRR